MRVRLHPYTRGPHNAEHVPAPWDKSFHRFQWLSRNGFRLAVAGRLLPGQSEAEERAGYARLFDELGVMVEGGLVLFPEMDAAADVPEISEACWGILGVSPSTMMCATSRMVVKAKGAARPHVVACTLLPRSAEPTSELQSLIRHS